MSATLTDPAPHLLRHGERSLYRIGCRCEPCRAFQSDRMKAYRQQKAFTEFQSKLTRWSVESLNKIVLDTPDLNSPHYCLPVSKATHSLTIIDGDTVVGSYPRPLVAALYLGRKYPTQNQSVSQDCSLIACANPNHYVIDDAGTHKTDEYVFPAVRNLSNVVSVNTGLHDDLIGRYLKVVGEKTGARQDSTICITGKVVFPTEPAAFMGIAINREVFGDDASPLRVYRCHVCSYWHHASKH